MENMAANFLMSGILIGKKANFVVVVVLVGVLVGHFKVAWLSVFFILPPTFPPEFIKIIKK